MTSAKEITSIAEFMEWVKQSTLTSDNEQQQETLAYFYRGHADTAYQLQPSVYRIDNQNKSYRTVEYQLYQDMLHRNPTAFSGDKTSFEKLVRMQHHGLPTRLLDFTQSPLVSLFFACHENCKKDGEVIFFSVPQSKINYPSAISETAVMAGLEPQLNLLDIAYALADSIRSFFKNFKVSDHEEFNKAIHKIQSDINQGIDTIELHPNLSSVINYLKHIEEQSIPFFFSHWTESLKSETQTSKILDQINTAFNSVSFLLDFHSQYLQFKKNSIISICEKLNIRNFNSYVHFHHLLRTFTYFNFVYPPLNNERIRRQQGVFLIFPLMEINSCSITNFYQPKRITIKAEVKETLLQELANLGITRSYLFPELEEQAKDILLRYPPLEHIS